MTYEEAVASCVADGTWHRSECEAWARDRMVGGVFCDGTIVLSADGQRCVPRETLDAKQSAERAMPPPPAPSSPPSRLPLVLVAAAVVAVVVLAR